METLMNFLGSGLSGGLFGILGGLATSWITYKTKKEERKDKLEEIKLKQSHEVNMIKATTDATIAEVQANIQRDQIQTEGAIDLQDSKNKNQLLMKLTENYVKADLVDKMMFNKNLYTAWITIPVAIILTFIHGIVDVLRTLVRVVITYGSVGFSSFLLWYAFDLYQKLGLTFTATELHDIIMKLLMLLTLTTSTAISFWFTDKSMSRKMQGVS